MKSITKIATIRPWLVALVASLAIVFPVAASTWERLTPGTDPTYGSPQPRQGHFAVYNPDSNRMMVFGGELDRGGSHTLTNEVWVLTHADGTGGPSTWTKLSPVGDPVFGFPSPRAMTAGAYDRATNSIVVYGGDPMVGWCFHAVNDSWLLSAADGTVGTPQWTKLNPAGGPPDIRVSPRVAYDEAHSTLLVFGGASNACGTLTNEPWILSPFATAPVWTMLNPDSPLPTPRGGNANVFDMTSTRMITFGGYDGTCLNDAWILALDAGGTPAWTQVNPAGALPPPRTDSSGIYDVRSNRMVVFGGGYCTPINNEVWILEGANGLGVVPAWIRLNPTGTLPPPRTFHSAVYNPTSNRMIVFGGTVEASSGTLANDVWVLTDANGISEIKVSIDIHPGSATNPINLRSKGRIPVAILKTPAFDPLDIDLSTVRFGRTGSEAAALQFSAEDVNADGLVDMILHFETQDTGLVCLDTSATLTGQTQGRQPIIGSDAVTTLGCK